MQLGFVIDQSRCIGCHACTVACKSENGVPLGSFRTWVKYTERGTFPQIRRAFTVLRCNQCSNAPCVTICPVRALHKRADGIVDIDPAACIGCKACMHACPYDALYINDDEGVAQKCHFCAHRVEVGLAPACAVICPTEAIIPGDFDDPASLVSRIRAEGRLAARKLEAGTRPNVLYEQADRAGLDPALTNAAGGFLWADVRQRARRDAELFESSERPAEARTVYDVDHPPVWGGKIVAYLFTKSLAAGVLLASLPALPPLERRALADPWLAPLLALVLLGLTSATLIADLKRPDRFYFILTRPNLSSWLARGTFALAAYGGVVAAWLACAVVGIAPRGAMGWLMLAATALTAALCAAYTGWLFAQSKGRALWLRRGYWLQLIVQALTAGSAILLVAHSFIDPGPPAGLLRLVLIASVAGQLAFVLVEDRLAPVARADEHRRALRLISHGPYARRHWRIGVLLGHVVPLMLLLIPGAGPMWALAGLLALVGLYVEEELFVRAGQAIPIS